MHVRLTRKHADALNGVDLSHARVGDSIEVPLRDGLMLIAEGWAVPVDRAPGARAEAADRPRKRRKPRKRRR